MSATVSPVLSTTLDSFPTSSWQSTVQFATPVPIRWKALPDALNRTQQSFVLATVHRAANSSVVPIILLESFFFGALTVGIVFGSYIIWSRRLSRRLLISSLWFMGLPDPSSFDSVYNSDSGPLDLDQDSSRNVYQSWQYFATVLSLLEPLITETVLLGTTAALFGCMLYASLPAIRSRIFANMFIPAVATFMATTSLVHWSIGLAQFLDTTTWASNELSTGEYQSEWYRNAPSSVLLVMLSLNTILSDTIVLWRTYIVWDRSRRVLIFAATLILVTSCMTIANIIVVAGELGIPTNYKDEERVITFGQNQLGLATVYLSLASNVCATSLVALRIWLHRRQLATHARTANRRTFMERFMELLIDSGTAYTLLWVFYILSFYIPLQAAPLISHSALDYVTTVDHLDAAMAQITAIYPLLIFILVALDKTHSARGPRVLRERVGANGALTLTFDNGVDAEKDVMLDLGTHGLVQLSSQQEEVQEEPPTYKGPDVW
ncbi:hypothetical protein PENSPDRAFT_689969 [Peniophora sp. CONT]|nr:hypothetical protein PENSPDRAFT_689969 [Peniophora sp. CONT]